jgi:hypothetical protein
MLKTKEARGLWIEDWRLKKTHCKGTKDIRHRFTLPGHKAPRTRINTDEKTRSKKLDARNKN